MCTVIFLFDFIATKTLALYIDEFYISESDFLTRYCLTSQCNRVLSDIFIFTIQSRCKRSHSSVYVFFFFFFLMLKCELSC